MGTGYWASTLQSRLRRRRFLGAATAGLSAAALLAACGGDDDNEQVPATGTGGGTAPGASPTQSASASLLSERVDTTSQAVRGGIWQKAQADDQLNFDLNTHGNTPSYVVMAPVYSQLVRYGRGMGERAPSVDLITGDAADSWEFSPDGLQVTFHIRPNHKYDPRPPTSGRAMTSADVMWSWERTAALSPFSGDIVHAMSEAGPIESVSAPDDQSVTFQLAFPYAPILEVFAYYSYFWVLPREGDGEIDLRGEARGSGPFFLEKWTPSVSMEYRRNPDWYESGRPFLDGINSAIIPEYSATLAQFETGTLWSFSDGNQRVAAEDILPVKRRHPELVLLQEPPIGSPEAFYLMLSAKPDSPLRDVRVRQAASMLMDRELYAETFYNFAQFRDAGLPVESVWHGHLAAQSSTWIDPKGDELGEGAKYFKYDPEEAKRLLDAAAVDVPIAFWQRQRSPDFPAVLFNFLSEGMQMTGPRTLDRETEWRPLCQVSKGAEVDGFCDVVAAGYNDESFLVNKYTPGGKFSVSPDPIPGISDAIQRARQEFDTDERNELIRQIQRDLAVLMPDIPELSFGHKYSLHWPWFKNYGVFTWGGIFDRSSSRLHTEYWYDESARTS